MADITQLPTESVLVPRHTLDAIIEAFASILRLSGHGFDLMIDRLDQHDGDFDLEDDDPREDEDPSGQSDEDGINTGTGTFGWGGPAGPGCPISDPDSAVDDRACDPDEGI